MADEPLRLGDITVERIVEQEGAFFSAAEFFPDLTAELLAENAWLRPRFIDAEGMVILCIQSYLVRTRHHTILVDTCVGNHKSRPGRPFWHQMASDRYERNLASVGVSVDDIDIVMCTHLHADHVGWNTRLENGRWVPTFPKARYLFGQKELDYWSGRHRETPDAVPWMGDSVLPVIEAKRAELVASDHQLDDDVILLPTPGHTPDHFSVRVGRKDRDAIITGDMIHSPLQVPYPEIGMFSDYDRPLGGETRRRVLSMCCDTPTILCTAHFPAPSRVTVGRKGDRFTCVGL